LHFKFQSNIPDPRYMKVKAFDQIDKDEVDPFLSISAKAA
jgi:hypothetical protein